MSSRLKEDLELLKKLFPVTHDRFRIKSCSTESICCDFIDANGQKIPITGTITASASSAVWYTEAEDQQQMTDTLSELSKAAEKSPLLAQVRKLVRDLCSIYKLPPPAELSQLVGSDHGVKKSGSVGPAHSKEPSATESDSQYSTGSDVSVFDMSSDTVDKDLQKAGNLLTKLKGAPKSATATGRLMREFRAIRMTKAHKNGDISVDLIDDNLFEWSVKIRKVDEESELAKDLKKLHEKYGQDFIHLYMKFKDNHPYDFPIIGIVTPRVTDGHVFESGAICIELLTKEKWSGAYTAEDVIAQVISLLCSGGARIRFDSMTMTPYDRENLENAYAKLSAYHNEYGWFTPPNVKG